MDRQGQIQVDSIKEGIRLAHMYDNAKDLNAVDQKVHDALLVDAIKDHHCQLNLKMVRAAMKREADLMNNPSLVIKDADYTTNRSWKLPVVGFEIGGNVLYDILEAAKAIEEDDRRRAAEKIEAKTENRPKWNPFDGSFGVSTAMGILFGDEH